MLMPRSLPFRPELRDFCSAERERQLRASAVRVDADTSRRIIHWRNCVNLSRVARYAHVLKQGCGCRFRGAVIILVNAEFPSGAARIANCHHHTDDLRTGRGAIQINCRGIGRCILS